FSQVAEALGAEHKTFAGEVLKAVKAERDRLWRRKVHDDINWQIFDRGVEAFTWSAIIELGSNGKKRGLVTGAPKGSTFDQFLQDMAGSERNGTIPDKPAVEPFVAIRQQLEKPFASGLF